MQYCFINVISIAKKPQKVVPRSERKMLCLDVCVNKHYLVSILDMKLGKTILLHPYEIIRGVSTYPNMFIFVYLRTKNLPIYCNIVYIC